MSGDGSVLRLAGGALIIAAGALAFDAQRREAPEPVPYSVAARSHGAVPAALPTGLTIASAYASPSPVHDRTIWAASPAQRTRPDRAHRKRRAAPERSLRARPLTVRDRVAAAGESPAAAVSARIIAADNAPPASPAPSASPVPSPVPYPDGTGP